MAASPHDYMTRDPKTPGGREAIWEGFTRGTSSRRSSGALSESQLAELTPGEQVQYALEGVRQEYADRGFSVFSAAKVSAAAQMLSGFSVGAVNAMTPEQQAAYIEKNFNAPFIEADVTVARFMDSERAKIARPDEPLAKPAPGESFRQTEARIDVLSKKLDDDVIRATNADLRRRGQGIHILSESELNAFASGAELTTHAPISERSPPTPPPPSPPATDSPEAQVWSNGRITVISPDGKIPPGAFMQYPPTSPRKPVGFGATQPTLWPSSQDNGGPAFAAPMSNFAPGYSGVPAGFAGQPQHAYAPQPVTHAMPPKRSFFERISDWFSNLFKRGEPSQPAALSLQTQNLPAASGQDAFVGPGFVPGGPGGMRQR